jgi:hypothetical protein
MREELGSKMPSPTVRQKTKSPLTMSREMNLNEIRGNILRDSSNVRERFNDSILT